MQDSLFTPQDKIKILFKEYDTLRAEIITRTSSGFQVLGIGAAVLTWLLVQPINRKFWIMFLAFAIAFSMIALLAFGEIYKCSRRVAALERKINAFADDDLLAWESRLSAGASGLV